MLRNPSQTFLTASYEIYDGNDKVGVARVDEGVITALAVMEDAEEDWKGQILSVMLRKICEAANNANANLSIMVPDAKTQRLKRFLEAFNFRQTHVNIFKRTAGSSIPPSVIY